MDASELIGRFRAQAWVDDPFLGPVLPADFEAGSPAWPAHPRWAGLRPIATTQAGGRTVSELELSAADHAQPNLPVGIVWDETSHPPRARVYYNKALLGSSEVRGPIIPPVSELELHPTMQRYSAALRRADEQGILDALEPGVRIRGPMGWLEAEDVRATFAHRLASGGGVPIMYVTCTDDGSRAALEFISWRVPPHAGLGVYERAPSGRIAIFRAYEGPVRARPPGQ